MKIGRKKKEMLAKNIGWHGSESTTGAVASGGGDVMKRVERPDGEEEERQGGGEGFDEVVEGPLQGVATAITLVDGHHYK